MGSPEAHGDAEDIPQTVANVKRAGPPYQYFASDDQVHRTDIAPTKTKKNRSGENESHEELPTLAASDQALSIYTPQETL